MRSLAPLFLSLSLVVSAAGARSEAARGGESQPPPELAARLLEVSGLDETLRAIQAGIGEQAAEQMGSQGQPVTPEEADQLAQVYADAFDAARIRARILEAVLEDFQPEKAAHVIDWYVSPAGRKLRQASAGLAEPDGQRGLGLWIQSLQTTPPPQQRVELARRLDAATGATDQFTTLVGTLSVAMARGLTAAMPSARVSESSDAEIRETLTTVRTQLQPLMQQQALLVLLYSTRELDQAELLAYVEESESAASRWFNQASFQGLERGFAEASRALGVALGEWLPSRLDEHTMSARRDDGNAFGTGRVDRECVEAALARDGACTDFACHFEASSFMEGCLEAATQTNSLCVEVPNLSQVGHTVQWRVGGCARVGRGDNFCRHLLSRVQHHCHTKPGETGA